VYYQLQYFLDAYDNAYTLTYNEARQLIQVTEPGGRFLRVTYGGVPFKDMPWTTIASTDSTPAAGQWNEVPVTEGGAYRYLFYRAVGAYYCNIPELEFYGYLNGGTEEVKLSGTPFGFLPAQSASTGPEKAFDGDTSTSYGCMNQRYGFCGIDLGPGNTARITRVRFFPGSTYRARVFSGSNVAPQTASVITQVTTNDGRSVGYNFTAFPDAAYPQQDYVSLSSVSYGDGSQATYTYGQALQGFNPLLFAADDPVTKAKPSRCAMNTRGRTAFRPMD
jgi:YD repeat-containing protein